MYFKNTQRKKGFSLVELITAVAIIGILSTVVIASTTEARKNSRDKKRVTDISTIALAFQLEKELSGNYPSGTNIEIGLGGSLDGVVRNRSGSLPVDPKASDTSYGYFYNANLCGPGLAGVYVQAFETGYNIAGDCDAGGRAYTILLR